MKSKQFAIDIAVVAAGTAYYVTHASIEAFVLYPAGLVRDIYLKARYGQSLP